MAVLTFCIQSVILSVCIVSFSDFSATSSGFKGTLHTVKKTLIQKDYCVYYYILKERRFFRSINSVVDFSLNFK